MKICIIYSKEKKDFNNILKLIFFEKEFNKNFFKIKFCLVSLHLFIYCF